ncbi:MAG: hypothetical protein WBL39_23735 [Terrimicrobiaceae bacterium]
MEIGLDSGMAAVLGSLVGGSATIAAAWLTQRTSSRRELVRMELSKRETLYGEFINECSRLAIDALAHGLDEPEKMLAAYALLNRIRLSASDAVLAAAENAVRRIAEQYFSPNISLEEIRAVTRSLEGDPLKPFGEACRVEIKSIRAAG